jgi:excisionase family DNA binding protein
MARKRHALEDVQEDRFVSLAEIARLMDLSERTVHRFVADPQHPLPVHRFGRLVRVRYSDYQQWLTARTGRSAAPPSTASFTATRLERRMAAALRGVPFTEDEE